MTTDCRSPLEEGGFLKSSVFLGMAEFEILDVARVDPRDQASQFQSSRSQVLISALGRMRRPPSLLFRDLDSTVSTHDILSRTHKLIGREPDCCTHRSRTYVLMYDHTFGARVPRDR